jgi:hypothetical protein
MTEREPIGRGLSGFADLLDGLSYAGGRNAKLKLMADWLRSTPDPDRGWGLAALTGGLDLPGVKPALIRALIEDRSRTDAMIGATPALARVFLSLPGRAGSARAQRPHLREQAFEQMQQEGY